MDVGAGNGTFVTELSAFGQVSAIDMDNNLVRLLRQSGVNAGYGDIENGKYHFGNEHFDVVVCLNVLEHIHKDTQALKNIYRLLKKGGCLVLLVPAHTLLLSNFDKKIGHFRRYTKNEIITKLGNTGYQIEFVRYINWWAFFGWLVFVKLLGHDTLPEDKVSLFDGMGRFFLWPEKFVSPPFGLSVLAVAKKS